METKMIRKIEQNELEIIVKNSGLEIADGEAVKQSYQPFIVELAEIQECASKINFEKPNEIDEKIARELRLKTVKVRTGAANLKDARKKTYLLRGNLEQASYNLIAASCKVAEDVFSNVEKAREIAQIKRIDALKEQREAEIQPIIEFIPFGINLGLMSTEDYEKLVNGAKLQLQQKIEAEKKAEAERIEKKRKTKLHNERKDSILVLWSFVPAEFRNNDFSELTEEGWLNFEKTLKNEKAKKEEEEAKIKSENERIKKEAIEKEKKLEAERKKVAEEARIAQEKARIAQEKARKEREAAEFNLKKEREAAEFKLKKEREEKEKLQAEIKSEKAAELKAKLEAVEAERKAQAAPDKEKLLNLAVIIDTIPFPELKDEVAKAILLNVEILLKKVSDYIHKSTEKI